MNKIALLLLFFAYASAFTQTRRFIYELNFKSGGNLEKVNMVLDVDDKHVKFYDYKFIEMDSVSKQTSEKWQTNTITDQLVLRRANSNENTTFHDNNFDYFALKSNDRLDWKVEKDLKTVQGYNLQKAVCTFGGRDWTAWFAEDLPIPEGPYKFRGLPGLIFELYDSASDFTYTLVRSMYLPNTFDTTNFLETHYGVSPIPVTLKQYHKVKIDRFNDPVAEVKKVLKEGGVLNINGKNIRTIEELDQHRKLLQQMTLKYYSPVEKDKAIPYPQQ